MCPGCLTYAGPTEKVTWNEESITRTWSDGPQECQFPFWYKGKKYTSCTTDGDVAQPWCATAVMRNTSTKHLDMVEGMWGYCGDCTGTIPEECLPGGHTVLSDKWRVITGGQNFLGTYLNLSGGGKTKQTANDDTLLQQWYRFKVPGTTNVLPAFKRGKSSSSDPFIHCS